MKKKKKRKKAQQISSYSVADWKMKMIWWGKMRVRDGLAIVHWWMSWKNKWVKNKKRSQRKDSEMMVGGERDDEREQSGKMLMVSERMRKRENELEVTAKSEKMLQQQQQQQQRISLIWHSRHCVFKVCNLANSRFGTTRQFWLKRQFVIRLLIEALSITTTELLYNVVVPNLVCVLCLCWSLERSTLAQTKKVCPSPSLLTRRQVYSSCSSFCLPSKSRQNAENVSICAVWLIDDSISK